MFLFQQCLWQSKMPKAWLCSTLVCFCSIFLYFVLAIPGPYQTYPVNVTTENPNNIEESSERQDLIDHILKRYQEKVQRRNPDAHVEIKSNKLHVNGVVYTVDQILVMEKKEHKEEVVFFSQIRNRPGVLTSWSYPSSTPNTPLFAREPRVWYTHKFEDLVNLNETTLKEYYNEEWKILKRGLMRDRIGMFASNIAAGMLWTEGYPYKVEEVLEREREINATKLLKRMKQMNISTTTTYMPETVYQRMQAEKKQWFQKIRQEKKDYIFDILRRYEAHYRMLNKHSVIAGVLLWINSLPHWADQCILRYEWEQQNPGHKYKWHPKRRPISSSELSSSSITSDYYSLSDYASSSDSDYRDEMDDSLSWSEKKRRRKERRRRKRPRKPSQFTPEERKTLEAGIRRNVIGGL